MVTWWQIAKPSAFKPVNRLGSSTTVAGRAPCNLDVVHGTAINEFQRALWLKTLLDITTAGRVPRCSEPDRGSRCTQTTSPRLIKLPPCCALARALCCAYRLAWVAAQRHDFYLACFWRHLWSGYPTVLAYSSTPHQTVPTQHQHPKPYQHWHQQNRPTQPAASGVDLLSASFLWPHGQDPSQACQPGRLLHAGWRRAWRVRVSESSWLWQ